VSYMVASSCRESGNRFLPRGEVAVRCEIELSYRKYVCAGGLGKFALTLFRFSLAEHPKVAAILSILEPHAGFMTS
jgi:hypothetical protein